MSIAEKLTTVAENQEKVYKAGQSSMVDESKIIEKTVTGTNVVVIDDTSEIPHDVGCKVESVNLLTYPDSTANMTDAYGMDIQGAWTKGQMTLTGVFSPGPPQARVFYPNLTQSNGTNYESYAVILENYSIKIPRGTYTFSANDTMENVPTSPGVCRGSLVVGKLKGRPIDGTAVIYRTGDTFTVDVDDMYGVFIVYMHTGNVSETFENISYTAKPMLNRGDTALPYTPYVDVSGVTVTRYGANLFDCLNAQNYENNYGNDNAIVGERTENSITIQKTNDDNCEYAQFALPDNLIGQKITIYAEWTSSGDNAGFIRVNWDSKLESANIIAKSVTSGVSASGVVPEKPSNATHLALLLYGGYTEATSGKKGDEVYYKNIMVNVGDKTLKFEPYNAQTVQANADGTVDGIKSLCPVMTLSTDVEGVKITADYHKSWGKQEALSAVWDSIQQNGQRTDYSYAFRNESFTTETFKPKYDICPTNAREMFRSNSGIIEEISEKALGVKFDTSQCTDMRNMFYSDKVKKVGTLSTLGLTNGAAYELQQVFSYNTSLTEIEKIILKSNGEQGFDSTFTWCSNLKEIRFEGVIGQNISFSYCPLSRESLIDIIDHLSSTASGKTLTLKSSAVTDAFGSTDSDEWKNLIATKSNWTITLA